MNAEAYPLYPRDKMWEQSQLLLYMYMSRRFSFLGLFRNILHYSDIDNSRIVLFNAGQLQPS